jgi:hypothetical protein
MSARLETQPQPGSGHVSVDCGGVKSHVIGEQKKNVRFVPGRVCCHAGAEKSRSQERSENRFQGVKKIKLTGREEPKTG